MAKPQNYYCSACRGTFRWLHLLADKSDLPDFCELCGAQVEKPEPIFVPQAPAVHGMSAKAKAADDVYYGMEDASALRTQMMADAAGGTASDYDHTRITNLRTGLREGETAAVPPTSNPVSAAMQQTPQATGHQHNVTAQAFAAATTHGIGAYAGERARQAITSQHQQQVQAVVGGGRLATHR